MGEIKFETPNEYGIYLHDTPNKELFAKADRWVSNGCVRLEDADRFATWVFGGNAASAKARDDGRGAQPGAGLHDLPDGRGRARAACNSAPTLMTSTTARCSGCSARRSRWLIAQLIWLKYFPTSNHIGYLSCDSMREGMDERRKDYRRTGRRADRARGRLREPSRRPRRADVLGNHRGGGAGARLSRARCAALPRDEAAAIYRRLYWLRPRLERDCQALAARSPAELFDTGVNMGPAVAITFLQRALTALNRNGSDYPDLTPDGRIGPATLAALDALFRRARGERRRGRAAARARGVAGRALHPPGRAAAGQRSLPVRLAGKPIG